MAESKADEGRIVNVSVGVLGHVVCKLILTLFVYRSALVPRAQDSGKTSLVKALSTHLSTAALDRDPQSRRRGITLDLGFSSFQLEAPPQIKSERLTVA